jgi:hypothetical protein
LLLRPVLMSFGTYVVDLLSFHVRQPGDEKAGSHGQSE